MTSPKPEDKQQNQEEIALDYLRRILLAPVYDVAKETELTSLTKLSTRLGQQIYLKREDQQPVHSFKLRGAYNKLANLSEAKCIHGVVAASAGNHAQGLALAASKLGIKATIFMPITTPDIKVDNVRRLGAEVRLVGKSYNDAQSASIECAQQEQKTLIHPFDDQDVIAGQGTVAKELLQQQSKLDAVFIPVGGGGLLAGMAVYLKQLRPDIKVIGVEAEDSACLKAALDAGEPTDLSHVGLFADGVAVKRIGEHTFDVIKHYCDEVITVSSDEICAAIKDIFEQTRVIAEPAGALSLAGLIKYCQTSEGSESLAAILSGANMNFHSLRYVSERCELGEQKEAVLAVTIPEEKGSFKRFCKALSGRGITEFNYRYAGANEANIFVGVKLGGEVEERVALQQALTKANYKVCDFTDNELAKLHVRYMIGGQSPANVDERIFRFQFPEYPGALEKFLDTLGEHWNITLFHYRNHGAAFGQVLAGFEVSEEQQLAFFRHLKDLGYEWQEETQNLAYHSFLKN
ncbi:threonine ammonia-lyase, biosynthetic [Thalassotalea sp. M1531]|uniref:L-threonine dehydratase n=1 Tax=Thalassotalea algicola TaxID=2716224 RepID=A0A7Y0Q8F6_9GAMM|nr:threonine ammonia-lyase, biosynthetic [Thalassotalea algicola]NMP33171.1 threonine ammonia-lyase, biosynthetic [Thalassotalea algicola]